MKKRTLLTNIFIVVLMISIVFVLLAFFDVFDVDTLKQPILTISMTVALISVALIDIVFPLIDNIKRFLSETSYKVKAIIKVILFGVSVLFLVFTVKGVGIFEKQFLGIALFCVAYLAQFFIDLDRTKKEKIDDYDASKDEENYEKVEATSTIAENDEEETDDSF